MDTMAYQQILVPGFVFLNGHSLAVSVPEEEIQKFKPPRPALSSSTLDNVRLRKRGFNPRQMRFKRIFPAQIPDIHR